MVIEIRDLCIQQGDFRIRNLDLQLESGNYGMLMGKSGCGKTTLMEAICGLRAVSSGSIVLDGVDVTGLRPGERNIGYVPQDGALFPTMSVYEQIAFGLRIRKGRRSDIESRVDEVANMLGIAKLLNRMPRGLSGGETQRVAIGRAIAVRPAILCLDEPLSALDEDTRDEMINLLGRLRRETPITTLHITHQRSEAQALADQLFVLDNGVLESSSANAAR